MSFLDIQIESNVSQVLEKINKYVADLKSVRELFQMRLAIEIQEAAQRYFDASILDTPVSNRASNEHLADVSVTVQNQMEWTVIIANGEDAVFCEFGAGVYWNGSAGASPNPYGAELGFTIGSYGMGNGTKKAWAFKLEDGGDWLVTHGTPATMPMYRARNELLTVGNRIIEIWNEVKPVW